MYFLTNSSSIDWGMVQKNWVPVYSYHYQGRVYQNCKFHDPQGRGFLLGHCHISSEVCSNSNIWSPGNVMITSCIEDLLILFSKLDALQEVVLRGCLVYGVGDSSEKLRKCTPGIQELDLSLNLLPSWQRLGDICKCLPNLTDLNARLVDSSSFLRVPVHELNIFCIFSKFFCLLFSDNQLEMPSDVSQYTNSFSNVKVLKLNRVHYSWQQVKLSCFFMIL